LAGRRGPEGRSAATCVCRRNERSTDSSFLPVVRSRHPPLLLLLASSPSLQVPRQDTGVGTKAVTRGEENQGQSGTIASSHAIHRRAYLLSFSPAIPRPAKPRIATRPPTQHMRRPPLRPPFLQCRAVRGVPPCLIRICTLAHCRSAYPNPRHTPHMHSDGAIIATAASPPAHARAHNNVSPFPPNNAHNDHASQAHHEAAPLPRPNHIHEARGLRVCA
jgi:hypothetical protein